MRVRLSLGQNTTVELITSAALLDYIADFQLTISDNEMTAFCLTFNDNVLRLSDHSLITSGSARIK